MADNPTLLPEEAEAAANAAALPTGKRALEGTRGIFAQLGDEARLASGLPIYRKIKAIGRGAFGKAYLVEAQRPGNGPEPFRQRRVMKKLPLTGISDEQREAAHREAILMRKISRGCPFITQFFEVTTAKSGTVLCLVMEYCSGGDLRTVLRSCEGAKLPEEQVMTWAVSVGLALRHCHAHGIIHRDVKPENCFLRRKDGDVVLGDFGISCTLDERSFAKTCVGSPLYLSPEVVNQERYSYSADVWSWGVMVYETAMLEPPFKGTNICQLAFKIVSVTPPPIEGYSEDLQNLVIRLLEKDVAKRPSLDEVLQSPPLAAFSEAAAAKHHIEWPPKVPAGGAVGGTGGMVSRLRANIAAQEADEPTEDLYEDDFEAEDEGDYDEDFEPLSGSEAEEEYNDDFEEYKEEEEGSPKLPRLSESKMRVQVLDELGPEAFKIAESLGIVNFMQQMLHNANAR